MVLVSERFDQVLLGFYHVFWHCAICDVVCSRVYHNYCIYLPTLIVLLISRICSDRIDSRPHASFTNPLSSGILFAIESLRSTHNIFISSNTARTDPAILIGASALTSVGISRYCLCLGVAQLVPLRTDLLTVHDQWFFPQVNIPG